MDVKEIFKPNIFKLTVFLFIGVFYLYFAKEDACGVFFVIAFCYKAYGFPFAYFVTGDVGNIAGHIKTLPLGEFFSKLGNSLFNPVTLFLDFALIYLMACLLYFLLKSKVRK